MAVTNLNPGVGPANSDIAATIATTPAVSAQITANVPSASAIASAVAAPSAATIASTVAAAVPTLTQINTAVNTQTNNSAIASAVAGAVPTLAQITSTVQSNAGFSGSYTLLATGTTPGGTNTLDVSWSGTYRNLLISINLSSTFNSQYTRLIFNGDTNTENYLGHQIVWNATTTTAYTEFNRWNDTGTGVLAAIVGPGAAATFVEVTGANGSTGKIVRSIGQRHGDVKRADSQGLYFGSAITSIRLQTNNNFTAGGVVRVIGIN